MNHSLLDALFAGTWGPLLIFALRIVDVSVAVVRVMVTIRGLRLWAALIGIVEMTIWLTAVGGALKYLNTSIWYMLAYAGGFGAGIYLGLWLEEKIAFGLSVVRAVCSNEPTAVGLPGEVVAQKLREQGFAVTEVPGRGRDGAVDILNIVVPRKLVPEAIHLIERYDPDAFITIEDIRTARHGYIVNRTRLWHRVFQGRRSY